MTENSKINVTLHIESLSLEELENLAEMWIDVLQPAKLDKDCSWCETVEEFTSRRNFVLPLIINKKLEIYEKEYPLSDI